MLLAVNKMAYPCLSKLVEVVIGNYTYLGPAEKGQ